MISERILFSVLSCILILQTGCLRNNVKDEPVSIEATDLKVAAVTSEDNPPLFCNAITAMDDTEPGAKISNAMPTEKFWEDCLKLRKATKLSLPGSKNQNDEKALRLLNELTENSALAGRDLKFSRLLLQHVSQSLQLRKKIKLQEKHGIEIEKKNSALKTQLETLQSQLDQLKNIEIEIDKKERSVISPVDE